MKRIPLTQGKYAIVDDEDYEWLSQWSWHVSNQIGKRTTQYAHTRICGIGTVKMHRLLMRPPNSLLVDHVNGNGLDNRRGNLRVCTPSQNQQNQKPRKLGSSKFKGVCFDKDRKHPWKARIRFNGKQFNLGRFETEKEAALYYDIAAQFLYGEFARTNDI